MGRAVSRVAGVLIRGIILPGMGMRQSRLAPGGLAGPRFTTVQQSALDIFVVGDGPTHLRVHEALQDAERRAMDPTVSSRSEWRGEVGETHSISVDDRRQPRIFVIENERALD